MCTGYKCNIRILGLLYGVPQGSILGPLLFSMYVNYLTNVCPPDFMCQMYADDVLLYVNAKSQQLAAQKLTNYESSCKMAY